MKPRNSTAARIRRTAHLMCWCSAILLVVTLCSVGLKTVRFWQSRSEDTTVNTPNLAQAVHATPSRPSLIEMMCQRSLHDQLIERPVATLKPKAAPSSAPVAATPTGPGTELVATFTDADGKATAYVHRPGEKSLTVWKAGSGDGNLTVTEIGNGSLTLEGDIGHQVLRIRRRQP